MAVERAPRTTIFRSEGGQNAQQFDRGRIRVGEYDAGEIYQALSLRVGQLLDTRGELIDAQMDDPGCNLTTYYNRKITALRRAMGEVERTAREKGWADALAVIEAYRDTDV